VDLLRAPWVLATVLVMAVWYWRGSRRPSLHAVSRTRRRRTLPWRGACFGAGLVTLVVALDSPVERLADDYFWAHMLQHVLLMMVAAPLIVLGAPWLPLFRPLPLSVRRGLARALVKSPTFAWLRWTAAAVALPSVSWLLFDLDLGAWHVPALYDLTLRDTALHYAEHVSFVLLGILFWAQVIDSPPFRSRLRPMQRAVYTSAGLVASWLLAVVLTFAGGPLYPLQTHGGISALADQQLAAGVMLGPGSITYTVLVFYWLYAWLAPEEPLRGRRARGSSVLGNSVS
jgi:cytochrome c oxidase assembly factor CtaG